MTVFARRTVEISCRRNKTSTCRIIGELSAIGSIGDHVTGDVSRAISRDRDAERHGTIQSRTGRAVNAWYRWEVFWPPFVVVTTTVNLPLLHTETHTHKHAHSSSESSFFVGLRLRLRVKVGHLLLNLCDCDSVLSKRCRQTNCQDLKKNNNLLRTIRYFIIFCKIVKTGMAYAESCF